MSTLAVPVHPDVEVASVTQQELQASMDPQLTWNLLSQTDFMGASKGAVQDRGEDGCGSS